MGVVVAGTSVAVGTMVGVFVGGATVSVGVGGGDVFVGVSTGVGEG